MTRLLRVTNPVARKDYPCMASEWICNGSELLDFTFSERKLIVKAYRNNWKIKKGERYTYQSMVCCGEFYVFKAITDLHFICIKYDIYEDC